MLIAPTRKNVVIGERDAPGLYQPDYLSDLPVVACDRVFSFTVVELIKALNLAVHLVNQESNLTEQENEIYDKLEKLNQGESTTRRRTPEAIASERETLLAQLKTIATTRQALLTTDAEIIPLDDFETKAYEEIFFHIANLADNTGSSDEHRVLNYLVMRDTGFYTLITDQYKNSVSLIDIGVHPSKVGAYRSVYDVVLTFRNRIDDQEERLFARVDATGEWPFLVTKFQRYFGN
jgi:hypothetical protein